MKIVKLEKCPICEGEKWHDLDEYRDYKYWQSQDWVYDEPIGFKVCKTCGFVTYDYRDTGDLQRHYDDERPVMTANNIATCNRKNEYHKAFLDGVIKPEWKCIDIGCAQGSYLNLLHNYFNVPKENLYGTEWADSFRAFGRFEYGLNIKNEISEFDNIDKFDFISYYHVLEHIQHPDKELMKIRDYLADDGLLYIAVPYWFDEIEQQDGSGVQSFEYLYHMNHVNVFSIQSFKNLVNKCGFEVIKNNNRLYGYSVLLKKVDVPKDFKPKVEKYGEIIESVKNQKKAIDLYLKGKPADAIKTFPKFPDAHVSLALNYKKQKDFDEVMSYLDKGLELMKDCHRLITQKATVYYQWDEQKPNKKVWYSNHIRKAEELFKKAISLRSSDEHAYHYLAMINAYYEYDYDEAIKYFKKRLSINPLVFGESYGLISQVHLKRQKEEK
jgi:tetratricopeptide (TPR) repeat protein